MSQDLVPCSDELAGRNLWALATIGQLINRGRSSGWLDGKVIENLIDPLELHPASAGTMQVLAHRFDLSAAEIDVLWLLACIEVEPVVASAARVLANGVATLDAQLVEMVAGRAGDGMLARLARFGLIETTFDREQAMMQRRVRIADRVLELARGRLALDPELRSISSLTDAKDVLAVTERLDIVIPEPIDRGLGRADALIVATGPDGSGRATVLRHAAARTGNPVLEVHAALLRRDRDGLGRQLRAIAREVRLHGAILVVRGIEVLADFEDLVETELMGNVDWAVLASAREPVPSRRTLIVVAIEPPDESRRAALWQRALPDADPRIVAECARRYSLTAGRIATAASAALARAGSGLAVSIEHVHVSLRAQLENALAGLETRIESKQSWDDIVMPIEELDVVLEIVVRIRHRRTVMDVWGFADKVGRGVGTNVLFSGPPGTGKTMLAGLLAKELGLDLYQIDLSKIVSKYIGETEKQLASLFDAAESGHAILLFDEADSLFAKRTQVKTSNDRYANQVVNYLLQRMEQFKGVAVLTTNYARSLDAALMRRLAFHVRIPAPDVKQREVLWNAMLPKSAARASDLDTRRVAAAFDMTGGYIKNAVLRGAFFAAAEGVPIATTHLERAARLEYEAMGRIAMLSSK